MTGWDRRGLASLGARTLGAAAVGVAVIASLLVLFPPWVAAAVVTLMAAVATIWKDDQFAIERSVAGLARVSGAALVFAGAVSFLGPIGLGSIDAIPSKFEWPAGAGRGVRARDGSVFVSIENVERVQRYDKDLRFLRVWHVDRGGGALSLIRTTDGDIEVRMTRTRQRVTYNPDGSVREVRGFDPTDDENKGVDADSVDVRTPLLLWPLAEPAVAWAIGVTGAALVFAARWLPRGRRPDTSTG
jgi:hypothetical protein